MEQTPPDLKIRVLHIITKSNWGGAQRYVFDLAAGLPKDRFDTEVAVGGTGILVERLHNAGIPVTTISRLGRDVNMFQDIAVLFSLIGLFWKRRPHIVHLNSSKIGALGALAARLTSVPQIVFTAHGWAFNEDRSLFSRFAIKAIYWITMLLAHETIAVSEYMRGQVESWPGIRNRIIVIRNGIESATRMTAHDAREKLAAYNPRLRDIYAKHPTAFWIGTVAELHPVKGYEHAVLALKELIQDAEIRSKTDKIIYVIIGDGDIREQLNRLIEELGLADTVFLTGHVDRAAQYMPAFNIFLLASLSEGLGYVLLEAGMSSLPVVATTVGGIPEIVEDMKSGILVQPKNPSELAHAIRFLIQHPEEAAVYGSELNQRIKKEFSVEGMIAATIKEYDSN